VHACSRQEKNDRIDLTGDVHEANRIDVIGTAAAWRDVHAALGNLNLIDLT
jgi:hypothetical protein